jgi:hypothetical protein
MESKKEWGKSAEGMGVSKQYMHRILCHGKFGRDHSIILFYFSFYFLDLQFLDFYERDPLQKRRRQMLAPIRNLIRNFKMTINHDCNFSSNNDCSKELVHNLQTLVKTTFVLKAFALTSFV